MSGRRMEAYEDLMLELESRPPARSPSSSSCRRRSDGGARGGGPGHGAPGAVRAAGLRQAAAARADARAPTLPDDPYLQATLDGVLPARGRRALRPPTCRASAAPRDAGDHRSPTTWSTRWGSPSSRGWWPRPAPRPPRRPAAFLVARDVTDARYRWDDVETLDGAIDRARPDRADGRRRRHGRPADPLVPAHPRGTRHGGRDRPRPDGIRRAGRGAAAGGGANAGRRCTTSG